MTDYRKKTGEKEQVKVVNWNEEHQSFPFLNILDKENYKVSSMNIKLLSYQMLAIIHLLVLSDEVGCTS